MEVGATRWGLPKKGGYALRRVLLVLSMTVVLATMAAGAAFAQTSGDSTAPTSKEQCKNGGWNDYPNLGFKNQGDCVSYVSTAGKNPPTI